MIPIPIFLPTGGSGGQMTNKGCLFSLIFCPIFIWIVGTILMWVWGDPYKHHQPTFRETIANEYDFVAGLFNRKSLEEEKAEEAANHIYGKKLNEDWGLTNINALKPYSFLIPASVYLPPADLETWVHPKQTAYISFGSLNLIYSGVPIPSNQINATAK